MKKTLFLIVTFLLIALPLHAAIYYVDATDGDDEKDGLSEANAWQTIAKVESSAGDGDTVKFQRGETWTDQLDVPAANMTFTDYGSGALPKITGSGTRTYCVYAISKNSTTIQNLHLEDVSATGWCIRLYNSDSCVVDGCTLQKGGTTAGEYGLACLVSGSDSGTISGCTLGRYTGDDEADQPYSGFLGIMVQADCNGLTINGNSLYQTTHDYATANSYFSEGMRIYAYGTVNIYNNTIYRTCSHGIKYYQGSNSFTTSIYSNTFSYTGQAGVSIWQTTGGGTGYIYKNEISYANYGEGQGLSDNGSCGIHLNNGSSPPGEFDTWHVYENEIYNCQAASAPTNEDSGGIAIDYNADNVKCYRNLIYDNWGKGIYVFNADDCEVYYNIVYGNDSGIVCSTVGGAQTANNTKIYGNTCYKNYNTNSYGPGYDTEILFGLRDDNTTIKNNILYADNSGTAYHYFNTESSGCTLDANMVYQDSGTITNEGSWATWTSNHSADFYAAGRADTNDNPDMNDPANNDFRLQGVSPCIDAGVDLGASYDDGIAASVVIADWPSSVVTVDQDNYASWEIGAYVYSVATTAALTGTLGDGATEGQIVAGGETLIITLSQDTWVATIGDDNGFTDDLIAGVDSGGSEGGGWDAVVKANMVHGDVARTNDTTVTITLGAEASYAITQNETITVTIPADNLIVSESPIVATPTFEITATLDPAAALTGTLADNATEAEIVAGGETLIITLTNDTWVAAGATFDGIRQDIIDGMDSAQSEGTGWNAEVRDKEVVTAVVRTNDTVVTITLTAAAAYDISANESITMTVPASALVTSGSPVTATPDFAIIFFDTSTEEIVGMTLQ